MHLRYMMIDNGRVLATRRRGESVAEHLAELANHVGEKDRVVIDFERVEVVSAPFIQEVLRELESLFGDRPILINMNEEVTTTIDIVRKKE